MSRIRSIHPGLASDEAFMSMSIEAKAAWPLLWTECDDHGVFEWKPIVLKARIFPANNIDFAAILEELTALNCVQRFESGGRSYGMVRNFCAYQRPKSPSYRFPFPPDLAEYAAFKQVNSDRPTECLPQDSPRTTEIPSQMKEEGGSRRREGKKKDSSSLRSDSARAARGAKATRLPINWRPDREYASERGLSEAEIDREAEKFRNFWVAKSGKDATKLDWDATWRNWVLNAIERRGGRGPPSFRPGNTFLDVARELSEPRYDHGLDDTDLELPGLVSPSH